MSSIIRFIRRIFVKQSIPPLGRWNINYCNNIINKKIDLSNTDHCGPCGYHPGIDVKTKSIIIRKNSPNSIITVK